MSTELGLRLARNRSVLITIEVCRNKALGDHGALEAIVSSGNSLAPAVHLWPLSDAGTLSASQLSDVMVALGQDVTEALVNRVMVEEQLPGLTP